MGESGSGPVLNAWRPYLHWNDAIFERYFSPDVARDRPVYLDTDEDVLNEIGEYAELGSVDDFQSAVLATLDRGGDLSHLFYWHQVFLDDWASKGRSGHPLFIGLLAFFCLVASRMKNTLEHAGNNFYTPLTEGLGLQEAQRKAVEEEYAAIDQFWRQLNAWMREQESEHGVPTAVPLDHRIHVSIPLSQALLREQDREAFPDLFDAYDLRPGQVISRADMLRLLQDWVPHSKLSQTVKRLWRRVEVRERVAEIAGGELKAWDGVSRESTDSALRRRARLSLVATFRRLPHPTLRLSLAVSDSGSLQNGPFVLQPGSAEAAQLAFAELGGEVHLRPGEVKGWLEVEDAELVSIPDILLGTVDLKSSQGDSSIVRNPRSVVVLTSDESLGEYVEAGNVELGRECLLLVVDRLADRVEDVLTRIARDGYKRHTQGTVVNGPEGWTLFSSVQVLGLLDSTDLDLSPLMPLSWTSVELHGGVRLRNSVWLVSAPPDVIANAHDTKTLKLAVYADELDGHRSKEVALAEEPVESSTVLQLSGRGLGEGDFLALLEDGGRVVASASLRLRSADHPRPGPSTAWFGHDLSGPPVGAISASSSDSAPNASLSGVLVTSDGEAVSNRSGLPPEALSEELQPWPEEDEVDELPAIQTAPISLAAQGCLTGAHHWVIQAVTNLSGFYRPHSGYCKNCNKSRHFPPSPRRRRPKTGAQTVLPSSRRDLRPRLLPALGITRTTSGEDFDLLLEALSYEGAGLWSSFEKLARQLEDSALFAVESMRQLVALGHIDVALSAAEMRPTAWSVAPSVLAFSSDAGSAVLCGRRSKTLVEALEKEVSDAGGNVVTTRPANGPKRYRVEGLTRGQVEFVTEKLSDLGHEITARADPTREALALLPPFSSLMAQAREITPPTRFGVQKFDPPSNRWQDCSDLTETAAYRFPAHPRVVAVYDGKVYKQAETRLAKLWAATLSEAPACSYSPAEEELVVRAGSELPGLYGRVATLCSGLPPVSRSDRASVYQAVPPDVASLLWEKVTS